MSGASVIVVAPELNEFGRRSLEALGRLPEVEEILFVPDACPDGELPPGVVCIPSGPGVTTGHKRQLALERARGDVVALIDDDAYPHVSWLGVAVGTLREDSQVAAVAGPTLTPPDDGPLEQLGGRVYASPLVSGPHRWRYVIAEPADVDDAPSVNLVIRRDEALAVGFDSDDRWGEDTLLCLGLLKRGGRIRYEPSAIVFHSRRPLWRPHLKQLYRWSRHRSVYARRRGENSLRPSYFAPSALLVAALLGPLTRGRGRRAWLLGALLYGLACSVASFDRSPGRWLRLSGAIVATHLTYGAGFLAGILGAPPPRR